MAKNITSNDLSLTLAREITILANESWNSGELMEKVTPMTQDLLNFWFCEPYTTERSLNFHEGQRQAIMNVIYLHEVLGCSSVQDMYDQILPLEQPMVDLETLQASKYQFPKYAVKMATGTGKTWVMHALLLWQMLNARHEEGERSGRYTQKFLLVAPGLIVYDRLQDAFMGRLKPGSSERDLFTNDFYRYKDLFIPPAYRDEVFSFIQNSTVSKEQGIGRKATGEGLIAITNWHIFLRKENEDVEDERFEDILPLRPGTSSGNNLDVLDNQFLRGTEMEYLRDMPDLMVINDEAHHIHETHDDEVQWQQGLDYIAETKENRFFQLDFSATPYTTKGSGNSMVKLYFPHIVVDFDLKTAMKQGLVKTLLLDKRQALTDLEHLDYNAVRDAENKVISLSDGQKLMLRAGLKKLRILEEGFSKIDTRKHPKMLVVCEDTNVTPFVEAFLRMEGLSEDDVLRIDSSKKGEVKDAEWLRIREKLFNVDNYGQPKVIVSVMMLREGFDVNNICVIVPLRSSSAPILLEQIVGRGLRLMWREPEYKDEKEENRRRVLLEKQAPKSYLDMLSIIEHPKFEQFYQELINGGLAAIDGQELQDGSNVIGDIITVGLKEDFERYDMYWINILREAEEEIEPSKINIESMRPFEAFSIEQLRRYLVKPGETFVSQSVLVQTQFGKYNVTANLFNATAYNEYLQKLLNIVTHRIENHKDLPMLQVNGAEVVRALDCYIRTRLFAIPFDPFNNDDWKILLAQNGIVSQHIVKETAKAIYNMQNNIKTSEVEVDKIYFSTIKTLRMRESYSVELVKTIYERTGYPSNRGGFERAFMEFVDRDSEVECFIKINESQHRFASIYYIRTDGLLATYHPDFLVSTHDKTYMIETKGDDKVNDLNVKQKQLAAINWCKQVNQLDAKERDNRTWEYVLLSEASFYALSGNNASLSDICNINKITHTTVQSTLFELD